MHSHSPHLFWLCSQRVDKRISRINEVTNFSLNTHGYRLTRSGDSGQNEWIMVASLRNLPIASDMMLTVLQINQICVLGIQDKRDKTRINLTVVGSCQCQHAGEISSNILQI